MGLPPEQAEVVVPSETNPAKSRRAVGVGRRAKSGTAARTGKAVRPARRQACSQRATKRSQDNNMNPDVFAATLLPHVQAAAIADKLSALVYLAQGIDDMGGFIAVEVIQRLASLRNFQMAAWANQQEHMQWALTQGEPLTGAQNISKLCLAEAIKDPSTVSVRGDFQSACRGSSPTRLAPMTKKASDPRRAADMQLLQHMLAPDAHVVAIEGIPKTWDEDAISTMLRGAGLCMHCNVNKVERVSPDEARVHVTTSEMAQKCLDLDGVLVQHVLGQWPLRVSLPQPLGELDQATCSQDQQDCKHEELPSPSVEKVLARQLRPEGGVPDELGLLRTLLGQEKQLVNVEPSNPSPNGMPTDSEILAKIGVSFADDTQSSPESEIAAKNEKADSATPQSPREAEISANERPKRGRGRKPKVRPTDGCIAAPQNESVCVTTWVITKIPKMCRYQTFVGELRKRGFAGTFDFVYFPHSFETHQTKGYAFVNFRDPSTAARFRPAFDGIKLVPNTHGVSVLPAEVQGLAENVRVFWRKSQRKRIRQQNCLPRIFLTDDADGVLLSKEHLPATFWQEHNIEVRLEE
mmetsp:Transcript_142648/g.371723  ORF Transcript_142648/g.371723 Transcript_142648/m.371723 type:complete len:579 (+) Transcript_142648:194-1930(+)